MLLQMMLFYSLLWLSSIPLHVYVCVCVCVCVCMCMLSRFSHVWFFATLWTVAHQAPLSMGFSKQEYWSGVPCPPPGYLANPGIKPMSPAAPTLQVDSLSLSHQPCPPAPTPYTHTHTRLSQHTSSPYLPLESSFSGSDVPFFIGSKADISMGMWTSIALCETVW